MQKEQNDYVWKNVTSSLCLSKEPVEIVHICLTSDSTGPTTVNIRNGVDAGGAVCLAMAAIGSTHFSDDFHIPIKLDLGLYVETGLHVEACLIQYRILSR